VHVQSTPLAFQEIVLFVVVALAPLLLPILVPAPPERS
jgi:hypothetical protein